MTRPSDPPEKPPKPAPDPKLEREKSLADALRANLRRRKASGSPPGSKDA